MTKKIKAQPVTRERYLEVKARCDVLHAALVKALALVESVAEQQAYPDDSWKPEAAKLREALAR